MLFAVKYYKNGGVREAHLQSFLTKEFLGIVIFFFYFLSFFVNVENKFDKIVSFGCIKIWRFKLDESPKIFQKTKRGAIVSIQIQQNCFHFIFHPFYHNFCLVETINRFDRQIIDKRDEFVWLISAPWVWNKSKF